MVSYDRFIQNVACYTPQFSLHLTIDNILQSKPSMKYTLSWSKINFIKLTFHDKTNVWNVTVSLKLTIEKKYLFLELNKRRTKKV